MEVESTDDNPNQKSISKYLGLSLVCLPPALPVPPLLPTVPPVLTPMRTTAPRARRFCSRADVLEDEGVSPDYHCGVVS